MGEKEPHKEVEHEWGEKLHGTTYIMLVGERDDITVV